jgi:hypothetical protein
VVDTGLAHKGYIVGYLFLPFGFHPLCRWQNFAGGTISRLHRFPPLVIAAHWTFLTTAFFFTTFFFATFLFAFRMFILQ